ncbi:LamG domain-containing protein [Streptosporangium vulgare]|uniref:LamG domain-containing protein n=1 Tax=Streptosporangium vulgare TaxID=46190 RepID=A0ABV5TCD7_9ACTN
MRGTAARHDAVDGSLGSLGSLGGLAADEPVPVLAYGMDEGTGTTVRDGSGKGNNGRAYDTTWADGRFGGSVRFSDDGNGWIATPSSTSLRMTEGMTVSAWVNPSKTGTEQMLLKWANAETDFRVFASEPGSSSPSVVALGDMSPPFQLPSRRTLPVGAWSHLAVTFEKGTFALYVNGEPAEMRRGSFSPSDGAALFGIAGSNTAPFAGKVDEVRAYTAALSPAQVRTLMETPVP